MTEFTKPITVILLSLGIFGLPGVFAQEQKRTEPMRGGTQLPQPDPKFNGKIGETYKESTPSFPMPVKAAKGSPNVLLILLDDVVEKFAALGCRGIFAQ